ncbi:MAG: hypothetical protein M3Q39_07875 [Actinomycetota bacterium]|nr:hypothetical protein [Actinomycetota bacterium]
MPRVGITGHTNLSQDTVPLIAAALRKTLIRIDPPLVGVTCLARGADQLFAAAVLELGGRVEVVLPAIDYRDRKVDSADAPLFDELIGRASEVRVMPFPQADRAAYRAASEAVISGVDELLAVWDGHPDSRPGNTADAVRIARGMGVPVKVLWPEGARRA